MVDCLQCGKCCLGLDWTFNFDDKGEDPSNPSKEVMDAAMAKMEKYGLFFHEYKSASVKEGKISLTFKVGTCQNLRYEDGKAYCNVHADRPWACRNYFCEDAKKNPE